MTRWETFGREEHAAEIICDHYQNAAKTEVHTPTSGAGCPKACPFREYGGHCLREKMSRKQQEDFLMEDKGERVMCATCKHYNEHPTGMLAVERWCRSPIWERAGRAPHPINHDGFKLIMCNYWEPREEGQNDGKV